MAPGWSMVATTAHSTLSIFSPGSTSLAPLPADTPIQSIVWSPADDRIAVGYDDGTVQIVDAATGQPIHTLRGHTGRVASLAWKPDGSELISGDFVINSMEPVTALVWDTATGQRLATLSGISPTSILGMSWSLDSSQIITFGFDVNPNLKFWDATTYQLISEEDKGGDAYQIVWSPDTTLVALANVAAQVVIANPVTFDPVIILDEGQTSSGARGGVYAAAWSPDGSLVAGGNTAGTVRIWRVADGQNLLNMAGATSQELSWDTTTIHAVRFSADGTQLTAVAADGTFRAWDVSTGVLLGSEHLSDTPIQAAAWNSDGSRLAYGGDSGVLHISEAPLAPPIESTPVPTEAQSELPGITCVAAAGDYYAAADRDRTIRIWDATTQQLVHTLFDPTPTHHSPTTTGYGIYDLAFNPAGSLIAASFGGSGGQIRLFDTTSGAMIAALYAWDSSGDIAWRPDGTQLAARTVSGTGSSTDKHLMVWNILSGDVVIDQRLGIASDIGICWSPDGSRLATADGPYLYLSDTATWARELVMEFPAGVTDIAWSPDGAQLAGIDAEGTVYIVDPNAGQVLRTLFGTSSEIYTRRLAWSTDNIIAATNTDETLVWDATTGSLLATLEIPSVEDIVWLPDGRLLYGGYETRTGPQIVAIDPLPTAEP